MRLHHVQVSVPPGGEEGARRFYGEGLRLTEVPKPPALAVDGGCWFRAFEGETVVAEIHVSLEPGFVAPPKAHPAFVVASAAELAELAQRLEALGFSVSWAERDTFDGYTRFHTRDAAGNRVEVLAPA